MGISLSAVDSSTTEKRLTDRVWQQMHIKSFEPKNMHKGDSGNKTVPKVQCQHVT